MQHGKPWRFLTPVVGPPSLTRQAVFLTCLALAITLPVNLSRRDVTLAVKQAGVPEVCGRSWSRFGRFHRSSRPTYNFWGYCGGISTDHGAFWIVETGSLFPGAMDRADIVARLRPGCRYRVSYYGLVHSPQPGEPVRVGRDLPVIYRIDEDLGCDDGSPHGEPAPPGVSQRPPPHNS